MPLQHSTVRVRWYSSPEWPLFACCLRIGGEIVFQVCRDIFVEDSVLKQISNMNQWVLCCTGPSYFYGVLLEGPTEFGLGEIWRNWDLCLSSSEASGHGRYMSISIANKYAQVAPAYV